MCWISILFAVWFKSVGFHFINIAFRSSWSYIFCRMSMKELLESKHPTSWSEFEMGLINEVRTIEAWLIFSLYDGISANSRSVILYKYDLDQWMWQDWGYSLGTRVGWPWYLGWEEEKVADRDYILASLCSFIGSSIWSIGKIQLDA